MIKVCANFQRILTLNTYTDIDFYVPQTAQLSEFHTLISAARVRFPAWRVVFFIAAIIMISLPFSSFNTSFGGNLIQK